MKILAIDTSSKMCSVAMLDDTNVIYEKHLEDENTHSQKLMSMVRQVLEDSKLSLHDVDLLACSVGPGSFTGTRIGVSTVKAFSFATDIPIVSVSSLEGLAFNTQSSYFKDESQYVCPVIDAKNDNVYFGVFKITKDTFLPVEDFSAKNVDEMLEILTKKYSSLPIIFVGDGAVNHKYSILQKLKKSIFVIDALNNQSAISVGKCAFYKYFEGNYGDSNSIIPMYLKKSQAERVLEGEK